jgi:hypothetical protein
VALADDGDRALAIVVEVDERPALDPLSAGGVDADAELLQPVA